METAHTEGAPGGFRLLRYFSIASLVAVIVAFIGLAFFFREFAIKQAIKFGEETNVNVSRAFSNSLREHYIPLVNASGQLSVEQIRASPGLATVHKAIEAAARDTYVVRVRIYDLKGRTVYSSEPAQIGEDRSADPGFQAARAGGVNTVLLRGESLAAFGRTLSGRDLLASYVPVRRPGSNDIDAVFGVYSDMTPFLEAVRRTQFNLRVSTVTIVLLLYALLFFIVKRADDVIKRQAAQRLKDEETIRYLAHHDPLTGLPNRKLFDDRLLTTLARVKRSGRMAALMFLDLDRFKEINDTLGHATGDKVLRGVGQRLRGSLREADTVARLGGDEFTIILENVENTGDVAFVAEKIRTAFSEPVVREGGTDIVISPSIGIALYPVDADNLDALLKAADAAMYDAKAAGRNAVRFHGSAAVKPAVS